MNDIISKSQGHRLPYLMIIALVFIGFTLFLPSVNAETLEVLYNTDNCVFQPSLNLDKCKTVYEICDPFLDVSKIDFKFRIEKDPQLISKLDDLTYNYTTKLSKTNCRVVTIEGYKNPYKNVDNVLCYGTNCHVKFIWWNTSFPSKFPIIANLTSGELTMPLLVNDSSITIDGEKQYVWCNYTLNTTRQIVGYFYFANITLYQCIDRTETFPVAMDIETGNGTDFGNPYDINTTLVIHFNDSTDSSPNPLVITENSFENNERIPGKISNAYNLDGDYLSVANHPAGQNLTIMFWANVPTARIGDLLKTTSKYDVYSFGGGITYLLRISDSATEGSWMMGDAGAGNNFLLRFSLDNITGNEWDHWAFVGAGNDFMRIYKNGTLIAERSVNNLFDTGTETLYIAYEQSTSLETSYDEFRTYDRVLEAEEIMSIYENQEGDLNFTFQGAIENFSLNSSVKHFDFDVANFLVTSQQYQTIFNNTFTLVEGRNLVVKGFAGVMKTAGGATTSLLSARFIFNNITLYDEPMRSIKGINDRGIFTFPIVNITSVAGVNRAILEMKRTGNDDLNITNLEIHVDTDLSNKNFLITSSIESVQVNYTSTSFINIANFTIEKNLFSVVLIDVDHRFQSTSNNIAGECYLESFSTGEKTNITYERWLQNSGDIGSSGINHRSSKPVNGSEIWMMFCRSNSNNQMNNNITVYILNLLDDNNNTINGFQNSTQLSGITGNDNILLSNNYSNVDGDQLEILITIIMQSTSGSQDGSDSPTFIVRDDDDSCRTLFQRSLSSNNDIGTAKIYINCENITISEINTYEVLVDVAAGETLDILNISMSTYEVTPQLIIEGIVAPIVIITNPLNGSTLSGIIDIDSLVIDLSLIGWQSQIDFINGSDVSLNILNETTFQNTTTLIFNTRSLVNGNYTIIWTVSNGFGNNSDNITVNIANPRIPAPPSIMFCVDDNLLFERESERRETNGNVTIEVVESVRFCHYGCFNVTLSNWGNPGCIESDFTLSLILIAVVLITVFTIRRVL